MFVVIDGIGYQAGPTTGRAPFSGSSNRITALSRMSEAAVTVRVRKFMRNPLLKRRQMVLC